MDCFSIGSTVAVKTMYDDLIEGQVMAFDLNTRLLILKNNSETSRLNNVFIVNLQHCKDINVKKEVNGAESQEPQSINLQRLSNRVRNQVESKKRLVTALKANVGEDAQNLYISLSKMLPAEQVCWSGPDICVFNNVLIKPPYRVENVEATAAVKQRELEYVKKLVSNRHKQQQISSTSSSSTSTSSEVSSSTKN